MKKYLVLSSLLVILFSFGFTNISYGQGVQTAGGVNVDGSWYLGEGLKVGDYFEYSLCQIDLNDCAPIKLKFWIKGEKQNQSESLWDAKVVVIDGNKIIKGSMGLGKNSPEPVTFDDNLFHYAIGFKSSLAWLAAFATANEGDRIHGPQKFSDAAWGKIGAIGGGQLIPKRTETIITPAGTADAVVVGWYSGNNNEIWVVDDFPYPVKALTYAWVTTGIAPIMHQYALLDYQENISDDPFKDIESTILREDLLDCDTDFHDYVSGREATNTFSMIIQYNYAPEFPIEGCNIDWKLNFMNKYNDVEFVDQVHYDIWVVDEDGNRLRSYAQDIGRANLFNGFGQVHLLLPVEENAGISHYVIFVHGTGSEYEISDATMGGYITVDIEIGENPLLNKLDDTAILPSKIPEWIKNNAGWWAEGSIDDDSFIQGIQFLIKDNILKIPSTTQDTSSTSNEIPEWIRNNASWWSDDLITDEDFIKGLEFLVENGIIKVQ